MSPCQEVWNLATHVELTSWAQDAGTAHFTTLLGVVNEAEVPENSTAVGVVPVGTLNTTHPRTHWPAVSPDRFPPSSDRDARGPPNCAVLAVELVEAVEPLLSSTVKSSALGPLPDPFGPAHVVASIASQTCPADGVDGNWLVSVTFGYQAETVTLSIPESVFGIVTVVPSGFSRLLGGSVVVLAPDALEEALEVGRLGLPLVTELLVHAPRPNALAAHTLMATIRRMVSNLPLGVPGG